MKKIILITSLSLSLNCQADEWDLADKSLGAAALVAITLDWKQTQQIAKPQTTLYEHNPIIGKHPSIGKVNTYFVSSIIVGGFIADILPSPYRKMFLTSYTATEILVVKHNSQVGIKFKF